jgi:hypothetical protein
VARSRDIESARTTGRPPANGTRSSFPSAKNARALPSGLKNRASTFSVPSELARLAEGLFQHPHGAHAQGEARM